MQIYYMHSIVKHSVINCDWGILSHGTNWDVRVNDTNDNNDNDINISRNGLVDSPVASRRVRE